MSTRITVVMAGLLLLVYSLVGATDKLTLRFTGLQPLANGYHYEGWAIVNGAPIPTGKFNVDANGMLVDLGGNPIPNGDFQVAASLSQATAIVITIEPNGDTDAVPAATHYLAGNVANAAAALTVGHPAALGDDYSLASGKYILATPTDGEGNNEKSGVWFLELAANTLALNFSGVQPLANGFHYEGWAIVEGAPVTTGKFNVDANGALVDLNGNAIPNGEFQTGVDLSRATAVVITIEPNGDTDAIPADTHYLAGNVNSGSATLTLSHPAALGNDFTSAAGKYILATPTDGAGNNEKSGIWFLDLSPGSPAQGLQLPMLPEGWEYEGWAVIGGTPVTTGKFTNPAAADLSAPFSGPQSGPPFPGEDFLQNAPNGLTFPTDLAGGAAVISIEPSPDDAAAPFTLKPLAGMIPSDATDHVTYSMNNNAAPAPAGTASILVKPTQGLQLATLPAGWEYEGWVVINGQPVTTGKFTNLAAADLSAPFSGPQAGPPFPGEDFLQNAPAGLTFPTDLAGATAVISIEPSPDDAAAPFTLKPLAGMIPSDATDHATYTMNNNAASFPTGTAIIESATGVENNLENAKVPSKFSLYQNFPNPFNPSTEIRFDLARSGPVVLKVYNWVGQEVATLVNENLQVGAYKVAFEANDFPSGIYVYRLEANGVSMAQKMILIR
jgi:hypothetical protein